MLSAQKLTTLALLTTISLTIFIIELRIPSIIPIPGIKLGLANIITVYAIYHFKVSEVSMIILVRIFLGSIFSGNLMSITFSLMGSFFCLIIMIILCKHLSKNFMYLTSAIGAIFHNLGQIVIAILIMNTLAPLAYLPILILSGIITGLFTGICAQLLTKRLANMKKFKLLSIKE